MVLFWYYVSKASGNGHRPQLRLYFLTLYSHISKLFFYVTNLLHLFVEMESCLTTTKLIRYYCVLWWSTIYWFLYHFLPKEINAFWCQTILHVSNRYIDMRFQYCRYVSCAALNCMAFIHPWNKWKCVYPMTCIWYSHAVTFKNIATNISTESRTKSNESMMRAEESFLILLSVFSVLELIESYLWYCLWVQVVSLYIQSDNLM